MSWSGRLERWSAGSAVILPERTELEHRLLERLHPAAGVGLHDRVDLLDLRLADEVPDGVVGQEDLERGDAATAVDGGKQRLRDDPLEREAIWTRTCSCCGRGKTSMRRSTVEGASCVCRVAKTRWPVSAAVSAVAIVSRSRISPRRITSGSWRSAPRSASAKLVASGPISRWLTMQRLWRWRNSIGSSMVMMWSSRVRLISSITAASVVDLPEPVGPVTRTRPRGFGREVLQHGRKAELLERLQLGRDEAEGRAEALALEVDVHAEAREAGDRVGDVDLALDLEVLLLLGREDPVEHPLGVVGPQPGELVRAARGAPLTRMTGSEPTVTWRSDAPRTTTCSSRSSTEPARRGGARAARARQARSEPARAGLRSVLGRLQRRFHGSSRPVLSAGNPLH